jgi:hypothetical protein
VVEFHEVGDMFAGGVPPRMPVPLESVIVGAAKLPAGVLLGIPIINRSGSVALKLTGPVATVSVKVLPVIPLTSLP